MGKVNKWQDGLKEYKLNNGFILKSADKLEFGIHETIYSNVDLELRFSWEKQTMDKMKYNNLFWIFKNDKRIGGVHICPNLMGSFFMENPYIVDRFTVISALTDALIQWKDNDNDIRVYGVTPKDVEYFHKLGYKVSYERKVMIRPTEVFNDINFSDNFIVKTPKLCDVQKIGQLFLECYADGIDYEILGKHTLKESTLDAEDIISIYKSNNTLDGSTLVFEKSSNKLIAACIAGINGYCDNDFSEIGEIVVNSKYRNLGIASNMIKRALTNLNRISPATILCVTIGNKAESLYDKMGFFSGVKFSNMYLQI
ncbi:GNAT family N-acetyltransferase [Clostridium ihumii]|uniref:GNAT family N-acetyltransferase n=1 Tax=Clostridium ihumii TaxID=1470356 RepID=UPI003D34D3A9